MNLVFLATGDIAVPVLHRVLADGRHRVVGVICQPDRPAGRNRQLTPCPVKQAALAAGLDVFSPERIKDPAVLEWLAARQPDLGVVFAYGQLIPRAVFDFPRFRMINIHPSLLPLYRGAAPIQWALADGRTETGVSIMYIEAAMDSGDILIQQKTEIHPEEDAAALSERLSGLGAELLLDVIGLLENGHARPTPQDPAHVTHARLLTKEDGRITWSLPAETLHNRLRGFQPWPGAFFPAPGGPAEAMIKVRRTRVEPGHGTPGHVLALEGDGPLVATGLGALRLLELQIPGKTWMSGRDFLSGGRWAPGITLG